MSQLEKIIHIIRSHKLTEKYHLKKVGIFGSVLNSESPNDIDILIDSYEHYEDLIAFREEMENLSKKPVDVVLAAFASPIILHRARKNIHYVN